MIFSVAALNYAAGARMTIWASLQGVPRVPDPSV
jgi:hypothetical protein